MTLELHVWGPAFGLPSIDAECLATVTYFAQTLSAADYLLVQSSPSAVPSHHLPALYNPSTATWTSGFDPIVSYLSTLQPPSYHHHDVTTLPPRVHADSQAYKALLTSSAAPLLALSLYVSSANYSETTRPAYSTILPFPLPWAEPLAVRAAMAARAAHLGMSSLDTDAEMERLEKEEREREAAGWVQIPKALRKAVGQNTGVKGQLSPEMKRRIKLEGLAAEVFDVFGEIDFLDEEEGQEEDKEGERRIKVSLETKCLAFAYLALMLLPEVPRPWLKEVLQRKYAGLCEFVVEYRRKTFPDSGKVLPWADKESDPAVSASDSALSVVARFVRAVVDDIPTLGREWSRWWALRQRRVAEETSTETQLVARRSVGESERSLLLAGVGLTLLAVNVVGLGIYWYRYRGLLGAPLQTWHRPLVGLGSFGAAGAMFAGLV
ncbi:Tom37 C-terminal domain-containing protein [Neurospora tetraspora]|uniref:Tom37 C-terminal domain-containing protein n=1 Tax=Neurospora tetraspora TaxID=94610 RepID=A0AAE0JQ11_9PEZI|nr:Tom37 C-terminal domain-containing protein [Neurospora tetraspora]